MGPLRAVVDEPGIDGANGPVLFGSWDAHIGGDGERACCENAGGAFEGGGALVSVLFVVYFRPVPVVAGGVTGVVADVVVQGVMEAIVVAVVAGLVVKGELLPPPRSDWSHPHH